MLPLPSLNATMAVKATSILLLVMHRVAAATTAVEEDAVGVVQPVEDSHLLPVMEIDRVHIEEAFVGDPWLVDPRKYYVKFTHDPPKKVPLDDIFFPGMSAPSYYYMKFSDKYETEPSVNGRSKPLSYPLYDAWVNLPIVSNYGSFEVPLKCEVMRRRPFPLPDKTFLNANVDLDDIYSKPGEFPEVSADLFMQGKKIGSKMRLRFFHTAFLDNTLGDRDHKLRGADFFYHFFLFTFKMNLAQFDSNVCMLKKPIVRANRDLPTYTELDGALEFPKDDEVFGPLTMGQKLVLHAMLGLPVSNRNNPVSDRSLLRHEIRTKKLLTSVLQPPEGHWQVPLSDESLARFFFSGLGMFLIEKDKEGGEGGYVADMMMLSKHNGVEYKKKFATHGDMGSKVFFNENREIIKIEHSEGTLSPGHKHWEWVKQKARSAVFTIVSMEHLLHYHMHWGNIPAMALRKFLRPNHPLREALTPHFFKTHSTCVSSKYNLIHKKGPLGRALPFAYENGYVPILKKLIEKFTFEFYPSELQRKGLTDCSDHIGNSDGLDLRNVIMNYISNLFDEIRIREEDDFMEDETVRDMYDYMAGKLKGAPTEFTLDNMKNVWGEIIFRVSGMHQAVGNVGIYALEPFMVNFRMEDNVLIGNFESMAVVAVISGRTQPNKYPTLSNDWAHVMHDRNSGAYEKFKADLLELEGKINERNEKRRFKNVDFHPDYTAISITS